MHNSACQYSAHLEHSKVVKISHGEHADMHCRLIRGVANCALAVAWSASRASAHSQAFVHLVINFTLFTHLHKYCLFASQAPNQPAVTRSKLSQRLSRLYSPRQLDGQRQLPAATNRAATIDVAANPKPPRQGPKTTTEASVTRRGAALALAGAGSGSEIFEGRGAAAVLQTQSNAPFTWKGPGSAPRGCRTVPSGECKQCRKRG